jgi:hypothetical protein
MLYLGLFLTLYSGENIFPPYIYMSNSTKKDIYIYIYATKLKIMDKVIVVR